MDTFDKLKILSEASQYDLACACGTNDKDRRHRDTAGMGRWLYPVTLPQGGKSVLLKTLLSSACVSDCKYCPLRAETNARRCTLSPDEIARVFMEYLRQHEVFGLFLSSGIINTPDHTMERLNAVARLLRTKHAFKGYIHLKIIPGASAAAIEDSVSLASAVSLNIETPGEKHFRLLSGRKSYDRDIIEPLKLMSRLTAKGERHARVKCTTQFIVGASDESDSEIVKYMFGLYKRLNFERVYFSAYQPGLGDRAIPGESSFMLSPDDRLLREHRLYQTDFLIRKYGFDEKEIVFERDGNLSLALDPKEAWAISHPAFFPVNLNTADREALLRVPGLGPVSVSRILEMRKSHRISSPVELSLGPARTNKAAKYAICT
ncbi:MAG: hypothetical protein A2X49_10835 [Lentisphaerae bacterium GWF2_52_8]|nr:MAG: hypothetical protein A2X49_10835 [Lentisphaerae bacterium GWF2_52_8]